MSDESPLIWAQIRSSPQYPHVSYFSQNDLRTRILVPPLESRAFVALIVPANLMPGDSYSGHATDLSWRASFKGYDDPAMVSRRQTVPQSKSDQFFHICLSDLCSCFLCTAQSSNLRRLHLRAKCGLLHIAADHELGDAKISIAIPGQRSEGLPRPF